MHPHTPYTSTHAYKHMHVPSLAYTHTNTPIFEFNVMSPISKKNTFSVLQ